MVSTAIWDAVRALNDKIKNAAPTATAEELAYLGNAMEKIGGHVTLIDLADHLDTLKLELDQYSVGKYSAFNASMSEVISEAQTNIAALKATHTTALNTLKADSLSAINIDRLKALDNINTVTEQSLVGVTKAVSDLLAVIQQASEASEILSKSTGISDHDLYFFANL